MKITDMQAAALDLQLAALGQTDLRGNDHDVLVTLEYLLEQALENVRKALQAEGEATR